MFNNVMVEDTLSAILGRLFRVYDAVLAPTGLKTTQRAILAEIGRTGPGRVGNLAKDLVMDAGALAHNLKPLERDGLVAVGIDSIDRRNRQISLTAAGRTRLRHSDALWQQAPTAFETAFGERQAAVLREALAILISGDFETAFQKSAAIG